MAAINHFYLYFNLLLGLMFILIGFKIYKPFKKESEEEVYRKYGAIFKYGGIIMFVLCALRLISFYL